MLLRVAEHLMRLKLGLRRLILGSGDRLALPSEIDRLAVPEYPTH
jgi:hypothetical protein